LAKVTQVSDVAHGPLVSNEGPGPLQRGDNHKKLKMEVGSFNNLLLQNHRANFNQTWNKSSFSKGR
jgi:hypothetical protein